MGQIMNTYNRNTILYSLLTISMVASYWVVRHDIQVSDEAGLPVSSIIEIDEPASEGYELAAQQNQVLAGRYNP
jgi:hypothetical protein